MAKSCRIASWVYYVITPIQDALENEVAILGSGNFTWRWTLQKAKFIWPIKGYIDDVYLNNYCHYLIRFPRFRFLFEQHDTILQEMESQAQEIFKFLVQSQSFLDLSQEKLKKYSDKVGEYPGNEEGDYPGESVPEEKFPHLIAEYLINKIQTLPSHYPMSDFWDKYEQFFINAYHRLCPGLPQQIQETRHQLLFASQKIARYLFKQSYLLCEQYDIPASPIDMDWGDYCIANYCKQFGEGVEHRL